MNWKQPIVWILFGLFILTQGAYLTSVPALSGDEASEGENIIELWSNKKALFEGERSYIGPLADYVRMPFVLLLGHTTLALRLVTFLAAIISFWLGWYVFSTLFSEEAAPWILAVSFFSPVFILEQRISWAITFSPLFALLTLFFLVRPSKNASLLAGLSAGMGIHNHFLFVPTAIGILFSWIVAQWSNPKRLMALWIISIGLWAGISTQAVMLLTDREGDQGEPQQVVGTIIDRVKAFPSLVPVIISGSSFIARYTGQELSKLVQWIITILIGTLIICGLVSFRKQASVWLWLLGTFVHLAVLFTIIDRFTLRYFVIFTLAIWAMAGLGSYVILKRFRWTPVMLAAVLILWMTFSVLIPYKKTGGSTADFSLGNRVDSAAALVDTQPLIKCLKDAGPVFSENIHIFNRLFYLQKSVKNLEVAKNIEKGKWLINYRKEQESAGELCPELTNFRITKAT